MNLIKAFWIFSVDGVSIFSRYYDDPQTENTENKDVLISGFLSAITSFSMEITKGQLQGIITKTSQILFSDTEIENLTVVAEVHYDAKKNSILDALNYILNCVIRNRSLFFQNDLITTPNVDSEDYESFNHEIDSYLILRGLIKPKNIFDKVADEIIIDNIVETKCAIFVKNQELLITGANDALLKIWDKDKLVKFISGKLASIIGLYNIPEHDNQILAICKDGYLRKIDIEQNKTLDSVFIGEEEIEVVNIYNKKSKLIAYFQSGNIRIWSLQDLEEIILIEAITAEKIVFLQPLWDKDSGFLYFTDVGNIYSFEIEMKQSTLIAENISLDRLVSARKWDWLVYPHNNTELVIVNQFTFELIKTIPIEVGINHIRFLEHKALIVCTKTNEIRVFVEIESTEQKSPAIIEQKSEPNLILFNTKDSQFLSFGKEGDIRIWENLDYSAIKEALKNSLTKIEHRFRTIDNISRWIRKVRREYQENKNIDLDSIKAKLEFYSAQLNRLNFEKDFIHPWWIKSTLKNKIEKGIALKEQMIQLINKLDKEFTESDEEEIEHVEEKVVAVEEKIVTAEEKIVTAEEKIETVEEKIVTAEEKIETVEEKIETAEEEIETAEKKIESTEK